METSPTASEIHRVTCNMVAKGIKRLEQVWGRAPRPGKWKNLKALSEDEVKALTDG